MEITVNLNMHYSAPPEVCEKIGSSRKVEG